MRVLVAGASGAIGRRLVPMLVERGHEVVGTTRSRLDEVRALGADALAMDALNRDMVLDTVLRVKPEVIIHQLTAISDLDLRRFDRSFAATNRLRVAGTDHLVAAAMAAGVRRFVAQSYTGWSNPRTGGAVKTERDGLDPAPTANSRKTLAGIRHVEAAVTSIPAVEGVALRYGNLYGPGTAIGTGGEVLAMVHKRQLPIVGGGTGVWSHIHVDDAARATVLATEGSVVGVVNIVDDDPAPVHEWLPYLADAIGAKSPLRLPAWLVRPLLGEHGISLMTAVRGSSNALARHELGWAPAFASWRQGFREGLSSTRSIDPRS